MALRTFLSFQNRSVFGAFLAIVALSQSSALASETEGTEPSHPAVLCFNAQGQMVACNDPAALELPSAPGLSVTTPAAPVCTGSTPTPSNGQPQSANGGQISCGFPLPPR